MKKITIKDVAREAGVSVTLVSFVMNAKPGPDGRLDCPVNPETASRVLAVAKKLGYRRNAAAASLRSGRSNTIAVITSDISNRFFAGISRYIEDKAVQYGYTVLFGSSDEKPEKLSEIMDTVLSYNIDGLIVAPVKGGDNSIRRAIDSRVPVVIFDRDIADITEVGKVLLNDVGAGRQATDLLVEKGFNKIRMLSYNLGISSLVEREKGYLDGMEAHGLSQYSKIYHLSYGDGVDKAVDIIRQAISDGVDALFLPTYSLTALVLGAMKELDLRTPEDIALVGFDESDVYRLGRSTIAHIVQPLKSLAERSVEILHSMIENIPCEKTIILKSELVPGESVEKY